MAEVSGLYERIEEICPLVKVGVYSTLYVKYSRLVIAWLYLYYF